MSQEHREILLAQLKPSATEAQAMRRKQFDKGALRELADSIKLSGVVQPIVVREIPTAGKSPGHYEIVAGERRVLAAGIAGLERIPAIVRELDDQGVAQIQLIENLQREGLAPMHEATSYHELIEEHGLKHEDVAARIGKSLRYVYMRLKLLALAPPVRKLLADGVIEVSIAERIARIPTHALQLEAVRDMESRGMTVKEAEAHIAKNYMTKLSTAHFPTADATLKGGPCGTCPKRTGNQSQLFADVGDDEICTDSKCFTDKTREHGGRQIAAAKAKGQKTIAGAEAKKIAAYGFRYNDHVGPYYLLTAKPYFSGAGETPVRQILKEGAEIVLFQDPETGRAREVVHESHIKKPKVSHSIDRYQSQQRANAKRAKYESAVRRRIFDEVRPKLKPPTLRQLAEICADALDYEAREILHKIENPDSKKGSIYVGDWIKKYVAGLKGDKALQQFISMTYVLDEVHVNSYSLSRKIPRLEAAAKAAGVSVKKIRAELKPKPKKKAKGKRK
jgi:ParB/RepB/Spo0J family partition protein